MRILVADDNQLVRRSIVNLVSSDQSCEVCGEASNGQETVQKTKQLRPDIVLLDVSMPGTSGLETARLLRQQVPQTTIIIMSHHDRSQLRAHSLEAGAHECIDKARIASDLLPTIKRLHGQASS